MCCQTSSRPPEQTTRRQPNYYQIMIILSTTKHVAFCCVACRMHSTSIQKNDERKRSRRLLHLYHTSSDGDSSLFSLSAPLGQHRPSIRHQPTSTITAQSCRLLPIKDCLVSIIFAADLQSNNHGDVFGKNCTCPCGTSVAVISAV